jgi:hypothetical protein
MNLSNINFYFRFQVMIDSVKRELHTAKVQLSA